MHPNFVINEGRSAAASRLRKKRELYRLALAHKSVTNALAACRAFMDLLETWQVEHIPIPLSDAFISAIGTAYARPFTEDSGGVGKLSKRWSRFPDQTLTQPHHDMLVIRHELFAHNDPAAHKMWIVPPGADPGSGERFETVGFRMSVQHIEPWAVAKYKHVCIFQEKRLNEAIAALIDELYAGMDLPTALFPLRFDEGL
jgi:hypothetical protein